MISRRQSALRGCDRLIRVRGSNRRRDMADLKKLNEYASIGRDFIGLQFRLTPMT